MQNPIMAASGTCGYGEELHPFVDLNCLGGVIVKGLSLKPSRGNPGPRLVETSLRHAEFCEGYIILALKHSSKKNSHSCVVTIRKSS